MTDIYGHGSGFSIQILTLFTCGQCEFQSTEHDVILRHQASHQVLHRHAGATNDKLPMENSEAPETDDMSSTRSQKIMMNGSTVFALQTGSRDSLACSVCGQTFSTIVSINDHLSSAHNDHAAQQGASNSADISNLVDFSGLAEQCSVIVCDLSCLVDSSVGQADDNGSKNVDDVIIHEEMSADGFKYQPESTFADIVCEEDKSENVGDSFRLCPVCGIQVGTNDELVAHIRNHSGILLCPFCLAQFDDEEALVNHIHCEMKPYCCRFCSRRFDSEAEHAAHIDVHSDEVCVVCGMRLRCRSFEHGSNLTCAVCNLAVMKTEHSIAVTDHTENNQVVDSCVEGITVLQLKQDLADQETEPLPFRCPTCLRVFTSGLYLRRHIRRVHAKSEYRPVARRNGSFVKAYSCDVCRQQLSSARSLMRHRQRLHENTESSDGDLLGLGLVKSEANSTSFVCKKCGKGFFWKSNLRTHLYNSQCSDTQAETENIGEHGCGVCGRRFSHLHHLRMHLVAHANKSHSPPRYICSECGHSFSDARQLRVHILRRHSRTKPFQCSTCGRSFAVVAELNEHVANKHEGRKYVCEQCGHESNSRSALLTHIRHSHPKPGYTRPYACTLCTRSYYSAAALKQHETAHADAGSSKRKSMCSICRMRFRHIYNLAHHIITSHDNVQTLTPFACSTCEEQFENGALFKKHYRAKHRSR